MKGCYHTRIRTTYPMCSHTLFSTSSFKQFAIPLFTPLVIYITVFECYIERDSVYVYVFDTKNICKYIKLHTHKAC